MYSMWLDASEQALWRKYLAMTGRLQAAMNRQLQQECGLSLADYDVLVALDESPGCRMTDLGEQLGWEQSRVSHQLRRMRDRGLVDRHHPDDDRRAAIVELTAQGRTALSTAAPAHAELVRALVFEGMTPAQLRAVDQWLTGVLDRLGPP
ncbi:MarR family winged helix-turn-helix transcriptional regulator [Mycolicibacterium frederiksbergense]|uniref:MarR family transcriptional regulator n=1 Tax=Mycolicibacterium frederiksbergense TaxID=117567 RepID=A0A6H0S3Y4_9MYCO|nr:MarR family winged helix-turn-helix transcriptional regulator [Mycolicibacterium frederiksbergense]QIV81866.1 MarR family transcriptional regulator [Mycolicibacterium frederiksbergense]